MNGALGGIAMMDLWRNKLVTYFPHVLNGGLAFGTDLVAGGQLMFVGSVSIRGTENCIALALVGDCDVLVAATCPDGEFPSIVGVELSKWEVRDVELVGRGKFGGLAAWIDAWFLSGWCVRRGEYCKVI